MRIISRILSAIAIVVFAAGPVSAAAATNTSITLAQADQSAAINGTVNDSTGATVSGVKIAVKGAHTYTATTDSKGAFSISGIAPGLYSVIASRPGYETASNDVAFEAGSTTPLAITMSPASFSSLHTIATVRTVGRGTFNTGPASVSTVNAQDIANQGSPQVSAILNQLPGVQISYPNNTGNGAAPGAITFANVRNALSFETASLIDGHPVSVGRFGDYVTTFLNSYMFDNIEVVKGPGAMAPQTNFAIGGTVNFRTKEPTAVPMADFQFGYNNRGGTSANFGATGSLSSGKLGYVLLLAHQTDPSAINNQQVYFTSNAGIIHGTNTQLGFDDVRTSIPGTNSLAFNNDQLLVCCYTLSADYDNMSELVKLRYKFSGATRATVSYFGGQATANQNGNTSQLTPSIFQPGPGYTGSVPFGKQILQSNIFPTSDIETNNEPILQAEVQTTLGDDTILARYYHATIARLLAEGGDLPNVPTTIDVKLSGTDAAGVFNDVNTAVDYYSWFRQTEYDRLGGLDLEYAHPFGNGNTLTFAANQTNSTTTAFTQGITAAGPTAAAAAPSVSIPTGSGTIYTTFMLRDNQNFGTKLNFVGTLYDNLYKNTFATACSGGTITAPTCLVDGSNATFSTTNTSHFDGRFALTFRPNSDLSLRAAMGSAIAPPYIQLLTKVAVAPTYTAGTPPATISVNRPNPSLVPETAFGYNLGADWHLKGAYYASVDAYLTNLYGQYNTSTYDSGLTCIPANFSSCPAPGAGTIPEVYYTQTQNLANSRYEGLEMSLKRIVPQGLGFIIAGSTQRGYTYNLPAGFYCTNVAAAACTPGKYNTNVAVVPNSNFTGCAPSSTILQNGVIGSCTWNQSVPYLQGNAELNWRNRAGWYASFGGTLFGKNNSYNEPPFVVARASLRAPLGNEMSIQISGNNVFNQYSGLFPIVGGGVPITLANTYNGLPGIAATNANVVGPATYNFILTKKFKAEGTDGGNSN